MDLLKDALFGFFTTAVVLFVHAYITVSEYFHLIGNVETALGAALIQSVILIVLWLVIVGRYIYLEKRIFIAIGSLLSVPFMYYLSDTVREGFAIFFAFI